MTTQPPERADITVGMTSWIVSTNATTLSATRRPAGVTLYSTCGGFVPWSSRWTQAVALEGLERLGEHAVAHPAYSPAQRAEAQRAVGERAEDERAPTTGHVLPGRARRAVRAEDVVGLLLHRALFPACYFRFVCAIDP